MQDVVVLGGVRTAIGSFQGSLKDVPPTELGSAVVAESLGCAEIRPEEVGHVVFGHVINTEPKDMYLARVAAVAGGIPKETPALTLNRLCGSGLQAVISAARAIMLGDAEVAVAEGRRNCSGSDLTGHVGVGSGSLWSVRRMASIAQMARRRAVSTTERISA